MATTQTAPIATGRGVATRWSPLVAYVFSAFYVWTLVWLTLWAAGSAMVLGWEPVLITSDSMAPKIRSGDFILMAEAPDHIAEGTVVTFTMDGRLITHRIVGPNPDGTYTTRGDANPLADSTPLDPANVEGAPGCS